jgi:hypothetical protein
MGHGPSVLAAAGDTDAYPDDGLGAARLLTALSGSSARTVAPLSLRDTVDQSRTTGRLVLAYRGLTDVPIIDLAARDVPPKHAYVHDSSLCVADDRGQRERERETEIARSRLCLRAMCASSQSTTLCEHTTQTSAFACASLCALIKSPIRTSGPLSRTLSSAGAASRCGHWWPWTCPAT